MPSLPRPLRRGARARAAGSPATAHDPERPQVDVLDAHGVRWVHVERPRAADRAWLEEHFDFHPLAYEDVYSRNQRPKVDDYGEYLFVVLHFPRYDKTVGRLNTAELDVFLGADFIVTVANEPLQPLAYLFDRCESNEEFRDEQFARGAGFLLYRIVDSCVDASFPMLAKMGNKLERIEDEIFEQERPAQEIVRDISNVKQEIINFRKIVRPQRTALRDLERTRRYVPEDVYLDDIVDANERVWDMLENFKEVVEGLEGTNESVLSHRVNDVLRVLTAFSVIILPLTLIASIWGMNVGVPGRDSTTAFWVIIGFMVAVLVAMVIYFRRRGFL